MSVRKGMGMTRVRGAPDDAIRLLWFLKFDQRAPPGDVDEFKRAVIACPDVLHSVDLEGPFDFIAEIELHGFRAYAALVQGFAEPLARLTDHHEVGFICRRYIRDLPGDDAALWVPVDHGHRRIALNRIDRVCAERDYVRVHVGSTSYLLHATMNAMEDRLPAGTFFRLHRSSIVRRSFIDRVEHRGQRWCAVFADGGVQQIARSHAAAVVAGLRAESSMPDDGSPSRLHPVAARVMTVEKPSPRPGDKKMVRPFPHPGDVKEGSSCTAIDAPLAVSPQRA
jgi:hypothetical protein